MNIDFFAGELRCETENTMVSITDLFNIGNRYRVLNKQSILKLSNFLDSARTKDYLKEASVEWDIPECELIKRAGKGPNSRTMAHISIVLLAAEAISTKFHVKLHKTLIEGKILEFRDYGGSEFNKLNVNIDTYLPGREHKSSNKGVYIQVAKMIRTNILGESAKSEDWNQASIGQTHARYEIENKLSEFLKFGFVKDFDHLKHLINKFK